MERGLLTICDISPCTQDLAPGSLGFNNRNFWRLSVGLATYRPCVSFRLVDRFGHRRASPIPGRTSDLRCHHQGTLELYRRSRIITQTSRPGMTLMPPSSLKFQPSSRGAMIKTLKVKFDLTRLLPTNAIAYHHLSGEYEPPKICFPSHGRIFWSGHLLVGFHTEDTATATLCTGSPSSSDLASPMRVGCCQTIASFT